jgi:hypothetical protein
VAFGPAGVAVAGKMVGVRLFDADGRPRTVIEAGGDMVETLAFAPSGTTGFAGGLQGVWQWDVPPATG